MELTWRIRKSRNQIQRDNFAAKHKEKQLLCGKFPSFFSGNVTGLKETWQKQVLTRFSYLARPLIRGVKGGG